MAKAAIAEMPKGLGMVASPPMRGLSAGIGVADSSGGEWRIREIADLKRILSGDLTDEEKEQRRRERMYALEAIVDQNVAVLISVSGPQKLAMRRDRVRRLQEEIRLSETRGYLSRLLKEMSK
ncbi:hypothetical protein CN221_11230 [Sinorhizobium meliloti]|uniref:hypothetical protein n=1 Tax=Rhizobium meliloti TaxID=382 RepID=UPI000FE0CB99|nr:hypothetical protein [Sinorhizobium meliloti]RVG96711.1 hypothetical protein CN221_11230 [Sinorhizobium meliloti]RVH69420.1 hypothetical protein CN209_02950 [Sinorhizobium meliloti]